MSLSKTHPLELRSSSTSVDSGTGSVATPSVNRPPKKSQINQTGEISAECNAVQVVVVMSKSSSSPAALDCISTNTPVQRVQLQAPQSSWRCCREGDGNRTNVSRCRFQLMLNLFLICVAGGLAAYLAAAPTVRYYVNTTVTQAADPNPVPGLCVRVVIAQCRWPRSPYNFTTFPNYEGHLTQREAERELELFEALVNVRCYELTRLFLCALLVPSCGNDGRPVPPCRSLCHETLRRCSFFLSVFGLGFSPYLRCELFPEGGTCVGQEQVCQQQEIAQKHDCNLTTHFRCDSIRCLPLEWRCDGNADCSDGSDERDCRCSGALNCGGGKCVERDKACDGAADCLNAADERNCVRLSDHMGDTASGRLEKYNASQNEWQPACLSDIEAAKISLCQQLGYKDWTNASKTGRRKRSFIISKVQTCPDDQEVHINCTGYECGRRVVYSQQQLRVVGGKVAGPGNWPFLAAVLGGPHRVFYCGAVLIASQWVLSAAHCVGNQSDVSGWTIELGVPRRGAYSVGGIRSGVSKVVRHPSYNVGNTHDNDVALFRLKSPIMDYHDGLSPVCLPPATLEVTPGTICTVIGWGKSTDHEDAPYQASVYEARLPILDRTLCNRWLQHTFIDVTNGMLCAGYSGGGHDACQGDSGGPLVCELSPGRWSVVGVVSWGIKCAHPMLPGVYANVPRFVPWIEEVMSSN